MFQKKDFAICWGDGIDLSSKNMDCNIRSINAIHSISLYDILTFLKCWSHFKQAAINKFSFTPKVVHFKQAAIIGFHSHLFWYLSEFPLPLS